MAQDGFDVELDDLTTFFEKIQQAGEDFRDGGFQSLAALGQFADASGLVQSGLAGMISASSQHLTGWGQAATALQGGALGLSTLALGASAIRAGYTSADALGASALGRIDGGVVDKMFAPPKKGDEASAGDAAPEKATGEAQQDLVDRLTQTQEGNNDALEEGVDMLNEPGDNGVRSWLDSYDGSTVVEVPGMGDQPDQTYTSPGENEIGPDLPEIDKYDGETREDALKKPDTPKVPEVIGVR
ncbi:hypothetical protein WEI85_30495 [Actinomycetes bacterium KLBMP 9797]